MGSSFFGKTVCYSKSRTL